MLPPTPLAPNLRDLWQLAPDVTFLNHGSFGATSRAVAAVADDWRRRIEAEPVELLGRQWRKLIDDAKLPVARFLNAHPDHLGFVTNATDGVNAVLRSLTFQPGDELVTTNHVYHAVRQAMKFVAQQAGCGYREIHLPLPVQSLGQVAEHLAASLTAATKLVVLDHVTSPTGLVFPVEQVARVCRERGIDLLVDGAHAPGMLPLDLERLGEAGVSYYAGNLHKWCCAVKGTAIVWARGDKAANVHPTTISHWFGDGLAAEFHWQGTRDHSSWLTAPAALDFMANLGWDRVRAHNNALAAWAHDLLCERWRVEPVSPVDGSMRACLATVPLPRALQSMSDEDQSRLQQSLYTEHRIEVPLVGWGGRRYLRVSAQVYNTPAEYERLAGVIGELAARGE